MTGLVSILIPAYNAQKWLQEAIDSALHQTWPKTEIIIVDDGSSDSTLKIARSNASPSVLVLTQENRGAGAARNLALSRAQGDYIQWLDADDLLGPDKIARQMHGAEPGHGSLTLISGAWGSFYRRAEVAVFTPTALWQDLSPTEWLIRKAAFNEWMAIESWLTSRRLTEAAGPWNESLTLDDDGEYFCRVVRGCTKIAFIASALCFYRGGNPHSLSELSRTCDKAKSQFESIRLQLESLLSLEDSPRTRAAGLEHLQRMASYFYDNGSEVYEDLRSLAASLGGRILEPRAERKSRIASAIFGPGNAEKLRHLSRRSRFCLARAAESLRFHLKRAQRETLR